MSGTARDYLVKANLAKPGRGKFSNAAKEHLHQAIADGHKFTDWDENGRIAVNPAEKRKFEKRADVVSSVTKGANEEPKVIPKKVFPEMIRYREETQVAFTHPTSGQVVVLDQLEGKPVWSVETIRPPSFLKGYAWTLQ